MLETSFQSAITISLICCCCCFCCYCVASLSQKIYGAASGMGPVFNYHISTPPPHMHDDPRRCNWIWFGIRIWISVWVCFRICIECKLIFRFSRALPNWQYVRQLMDERENARGKLTLRRRKRGRGENYEKSCVKKSNDGRRGVYAI